jgi:hypothetical protein
METLMARWKTWWDGLGELFSKKVAGTIDIGTGTTQTSRYLAVANDIPTESILARAITE